MDDKKLREELINALTKEQAHASIESALKNLKPFNRTKRPSGSLHSVWELLEHIRITQEDILQYTINPNWVSPGWPDEHWPAKKDNITEEDWNNSILKFNKDLKKVINLIEYTGIDLTSVIPHIKNRTYLREILFIIDHNSYHAAQIISTRKMLGDW